MQRLSVASRICILYLTEVWQDSRVSKLATSRGSRTVQYVDTLTCTLGRQAVDALSQVDVLAFRPRSNCCIVPPTNERETSPLGRSDMLPY